MRLPGNERQSCRLQALADLDARALVTQNFAANSGIGNKLADYRTTAPGDWLRIKRASTNPGFTAAFRAQLIIVSLLLWKRNFAVTCANLPERIRASDSRANTRPLLVASGPSTALAGSTCTNLRCTNAVVLDRSRLQDDIGRLPAEYANSHGSQWRFPHQGCPPCPCATRSRAASGHLENSNVKPASSNLRGTTRRLFSTSSVSVRRTNAPISAIHLLAGKPMGTPKAARNAAMNSPWGSGPGAAKLTAPSRSSRSSRNATARVKSRSWIHDMN